MTFKVGNFAAPWSGSVSDVPVTGPCKPNPAQTCSLGPSLGEMQGPVDASGRLWIAVQQFLPNGFDTTSPSMAVKDMPQWSYSIDLGRLMGGVINRLTTSTGSSTVIQAEAMSTSSTSPSTGGAAADVDISSTAPVRICVDRPTAVGWDWAFPCNDATLGQPGLALGASNNAGGTGIGSVAAGTTAEYQVVVPKAGTYTVTYRATSFSPTSGRDLKMTINGTSYTTSITGAQSPSGGIKDNAQSQPVTFSTPGKYTMKVEAPNGGWELDWIKFTHS
jgi:hypothetical protein